MRPKDVIRILEAHGWTVVRTKGSHHIMQHPEHPGRGTVVPVHPGDLKPSLLRAIEQQTGVRLR